MRAERRILANTIMLGAGEGAGQLMNFVVVVSLARAFGADVLGHYSVSMAVGALAALFVGLGTQPLLVRELSRDAASARDLLGTLIPAQLVLGAGAWLAACLLSIALIGQAAAMPVIAATCASQILPRLAATLFAPFQATEQMRPLVVGQLIQRLLTLAFAVLAIWLGAGAGTVTLAFVAGAAFLVAFAWVMVSLRFGRPWLALDWDRASGLIRLASPFLGLTALGVIYSRVGLLLLSALAGPVAVGYYAVADRLMVGLYLLPGVFNSAAFPALSRLMRSDIAEARALAIRCLRLLMVGTVPLAAMISIFSADIISLLFGAEFIAASTALQVLAWTLPVRGAMWLLGSQLTALDKQASMAKGRTVALVAFVAVTPLLILGLGFLGVAWALLVSDGLQLALYWRILRRVERPPSLVRPVLRPALASIGALGASAMVIDLALAARASVAVCAMAIGLWVFGAVRPRDLSFLRALIRYRDGPIDTL